MAAEKQFETRVKNFLTEANAYFIKYWAGAKYTRAGIPDLLCCINGYFVGVELKAGNGRPSDLQLYNLDAINDAGGYGILLYPKHFDEFKKFVAFLNGGGYYDAEFNGENPFPNITRERWR